MKCSWMALKCCRWFITKGFTSCFVLWSIPPNFLLPHPTHKLHYNCPFQYDRILETSSFLQSSIDVQFISNVNYCIGNESVFYRVYFPFTVCIISRWLFKDSHIFPLSTKGQLLMPTFYCSAFLTVSGFHSNPSCT